MNQQFIFGLICFITLTSLNVSALGDISLRFGDRKVSDPLDGVEFKSVQPNGGNFKLMCVIEGRDVYVTESGKPIFDIHHISENVIVVTKPVGFCTPVGVYRLNKKEGKVEALFESCDKRSVDYKLEGFDNANGKITFQVFENLSYINTDKAARLVALVYVYL